MQMLLVGLGGAAGAMLRYAVGLVPCKSGLPVMTLLINVLGALAIGVIAGVAAKRNVSPGALAFLKTGVCGGFTTFSTFSLETYLLAQNGGLVPAAAYAALSVGLCLAGIALGMLLAGRLA